jgi:MoxR-like ATPase
MKKILITFTLLAFVFIANAQMLSLPKESINNLQEARKILATKTKLPQEVVNRACYILETFEVKKVNAMKALVDKPAELTKILKEISDSKLNNVKGILPAEAFALLSKEDIAVLIK